MVYLDQPFGTGQVWQGKAGSFDDRWKWDATSAAAFDRLTQVEGLPVDILRACRVKQDDLAYLATIGDLLLACRGALKLTGTLWLHCDQTWGHYLRLIGEMLFLGRGEIVWKRTNSHNSATRSWPCVHDNIFVFARSRAADLHLARARRAQRRPDPEIIVAGDPLLGRLSIDGLVLDKLRVATAAERTGYPTQKPIGLLRRLIAAATLPGDVVLDPCCGSGTTLLAALDIGRAAIGIDRSADAVKLTEQRIAAVSRQGDLFGRAA
jgi:site-specific DNA-methyltransferase (adenine-specific)